MNDTSNVAESNVNPHCLDNIMKLSQRQEVTAAEDIYDARGNKLWAKDAVITPELQTRLLERKLRKPLEATLQVTDGVNADKIVQEAQQLYGRVPAIASLIGAHQATILETLALVRLEPPVALLLTTAAQNTETFSHAVLVSITAIAVGLHSGRSGSDQLTLALAGLLHDIGELYINSDYLHAHRRLSPDEWKHIAVHPRVGEVVLNNLGCVPKPVTRAVAEHHERLDGNGYPRQLTGDKISSAGQILGLAEILGSIIGRKDNALARASLALRLVPGEHSHDLISVIATLRQHSSGGNSAEGNASLEDAIQRTAQVGAQLMQAIDESARLLTLGKQIPPHAQDLAMRFQYRLRTLLQALRATGVQEFASYGVSGEEMGGELALELEMVSREIHWRLRDMARELSLRTVEAPPDLLAQFAPLLALLDKAL